MFDQPGALMSDNIHNSPTVLLDPENVGVTTGISLLSHIQAEIYAMQHVLPVFSGHL